MVGDLWSAPLVTACVLVVGWCSLELVRSIRQARPVPVPRDVVAWHGAMGCAMLVGLSRTTSVTWDRAWAVLFAAAVAWCAFRVSILGSFGHHVRLAVMSAAMVLMLIPMGSAEAAPGSMAGMAHPGSGTVAIALVIALALGLVAAAALRVAARGGTSRVRISACCEALMAGAMGMMAVLAVGLG